MLIKEAQRQEQNRPIYTVMGKWYHFNDAFNVHHINVCYIADSSKSGEKLIMPSSPLINATHEAPS